MGRLTAEKLAQAVRLTAASGCDAWITFVRETAEGCDPVLPLIADRAFVWESAFIVSASGRKVAVVGNYDAEPLRADGDWDEVVPYVQGIRADLLRTLDRLVPDEPRTPRLAVNWSADDPKADGLSHGMYLRLQKLLAGSRFEGCLLSAEGIVSELRARKTPEEIERIRTAVGLTHEIFAELEGFIASGRSEKEMFDFAQARIRGRGLGFAWDPEGDPIVNTGPDSMIGHGAPSEKIRVAPGHIVHFDLGVRSRSYSSDLQRCWFVAERSAPHLPDDVRRAFRAVHGAISEGARMLRPGIEGWRVDEAARRAITAAGYPEYLHALGHQVGRMAHDGGALLAPRWERYGRLPLLAVEQDQVYTLELGVSVDGRGYLGLEEMVLITADGCLWLGERQDALPVLS
jgi:Xaa-Pro aminopeptidase